MSEGESCEADRDPPRRDFLGVLSFLIMGGGLVAGYGVFATWAGRFLYPSSRGKTAWQFVSTLDGLRSGDSLPFQMPSGAKVVVTRQGEGESVDQFMALSSVCPHLGCAVHWEAQNDRFFCPCHNGAFDSSGNATEGPPFEAKQQLKRFPLKVENGLLYIEVPTESINRPEEANA